MSARISSSVFFPFPFPHRPSFSFNLSLCTVITLRPFHSLCFFLLYHTPVPSFGSYRPLTYLPPFFPHSFPSQLFLLLHPLFLLFHKLHTKISLFPAHHSTSYSIYTLEVQSNPNPPPLSPLCSFITLPSNPSSVSPRPPPLSPHSPSITPALMCGMFACL